MRNEVFVSFGGSEDIALHTSQPMEVDEARSWLDREFTRLDATVVRPTGKVLLADKVLAIAEAAGAGGFDDAAWADAYARAASGALRRTLIRVDVANASVGF
jgi:hypothetical protein